MRPVFKVVDISKLPAHDLEDLLNSLTAQEWAFRFLSGTRAVFSKMISRLPPREDQ